MHRYQFLIDLIPLLIPPTGKRLWIISPRGIEVGRHCSWKEIIHVEPSAISEFLCSAGENIGNADTVLILKTRLPDTVYQQLQKHQIAYAVVCRSRIPSESDKYIDVNWRIGLPPLGHPIVWSTVWQIDSPPLDVAPRGRFDTHMLRLFETASRLGVAPNYWHVRADPNRSLLANFLKQAQVNNGSWYQTKTGKLIIADLNRVLKIDIRHTNIKSSRKFDNQHQFTRDSLTEASLQYLLAESKGFIEIAGFNASVEARLPGRSAFLRLGRRSDLEHIFSSSAAVLERWYGPHAQQVKVTDEVFHKYWQDPLTCLRNTLVQQGHENVWRASIESLRNHSIGHSIKLVPLHGDLWLNNILVDDDSLRITGILDWDLVEHGLPCLDLFHLLTWRTHRFRKDFSRASFDWLTQSRNTYEMCIVQKHCVNLEISPDWIPVLFCRYWLGEISKRSDEFKSAHKVSRLVERICRALLT